MSITTVNMVKALTRKVFVLLLTGLLLLPGNGVYAMSDEAIAETEFSYETERPESVELPEGVERANVIPQNVSFLTARSVTSRNDNDTVYETFNIPYTSGTSLWFNDGSTTRQVIRTHNDSSVLHVTGGTVEIEVYQEGICNLYTRVDGVNRSVSRKETGSVIEPTFQSYTTLFTLSYNSVANKDAPYTIFTAGCIQLTAPGTSTPYTRHEVNVYIYWDT